MSFRNIDFESTNNQVLLNPRMPVLEQHQYQQWAEEVFKKLPSMGYPEPHFALQTSGSTLKPGQSGKLVFLSKKAILNSAEAVNEHLLVSKNDRWLSVLPIFHVGGLGVWARAFLAGISVDELKPDAQSAEIRWSAHLFVDLCKEKGTTLSALVPTQVFDLVQGKLAAPPSLRAIVVGGGVLSEELYLAARRLGWPLLPSFGMTETGSQIATADLESLKLEKLPEPILLKHAKINVSPEGLLRVQSTSLLTAYAQWSEGKLNISYPVDADGWLATEDRAQLTEKSFRILGRGADYIKVGGEAVNLARLRSTFEEVLLSMTPDLVKTVALGKMVDQRLGHKVVLFQIGDVDAIRLVVEKFNRQVMPFERIKSRYRVQQIPQSDLGKILWPVLEEMEKQEI